MGGSDRNERMGGSDRNERGGSSYRGRSEHGPRRYNSGGGDFQKRRSHSYENSHNFKSSGKTLKTLTFEEIEPKTMMKDLNAEI